MTTQLTKEQLLRIIESVDDVLCEQDGTNEDAHPESDEKNSGASMTTPITKERLIKIKEWRELYGAGSNVVLPAEEAEELARIALASLETNFDSTGLPGGFSIEEAKSLQADLVRSHISKALSGEKMKSVDKNADLQWIHGVIVRAAWFVKASVEATAGRINGEG